MRRQLPPQIGACPFEIAGIAAVLKPVEGTGAVYVTWDTWMNVSVIASIAFSTVSPSR
jgi:hypothetical protein